METSDYTCKKSMLGLSAIAYMMNTGYSCYRDIPETGTCVSYMVRKGRIYWREVDDNVYYLCKSRLNIWNDTVFYKEYTRISCD